MCKRCEDTGYTYEYLESAAEAYPQSPRRSKCYCSCSVGDKRKKEDGWKEWHGKLNLLFM